MIQMVDRPNTTPTGQDKKTLAFKALLQQLHFPKTSLFCMKAAGEGLYRSLLVEADFVLQMSFTHKIVFKD